MKHPCGAAPTQCPWQVLRHLAQMQMEIQQIWEPAKYSVGMSVSHFPTRPTTETTPLMMMLPWTQTQQ